MRFFFCLTFLCSLSSNVGTAGEGVGNTAPGNAIFVGPDAPPDIRMDGGAWECHDGAVTGSGTGRVLYGGRKLGPGDFTVRATLAVKNPALSAASMVINDTFLGFDGENLTGAGMRQAQGTRYN